MNFEELYLVLNKRGFFNTFQVLSQYKDFKAEKGDFYRRLIEFSNYNSFLRIKDKLVEIKLIQLEKNNGEEYIGLTEKGRTVFDNLLELNNIISEEN
jgi:predicted transcriptional regulator